MTTTLTIDVYLDLICPWCLIGKRHLDDALATFSRSGSSRQVDVRWHSVQLQPDAPAQGWDFNAFYLQRLGSAEGMRQRQAQVNAAAARAGFQIDFGGIARMPNTVQAHQLLAFGSTHLPAARFANLLERLFAAHFHQGEDLGERATLRAIADSVGLSVAALDDWWDGGHGRPQARDVPGVPFFVFNRQLALSGAQPPEVLLDAMRQASAMAVPTMTNQ